MPASRFKILNHRRLRIVVFAAVFAVPGWFPVLSDLAAQAPDSRLILYFPLQATDIDAGRAEQLRAFFSARPNGYFLVQGFACDTGGFDASYIVAMNRGTEVQASLAGLGLQTRRVLTATPVVFAGEPRVKHRRAELVYFDEEHAWRAAARAADAKAAKINAATRATLSAAPDSPDDSDKPAQSNPEAAPGDPEGSADGFSTEAIFIPLTVLLLILMLFFGLYPDQWLAFFRGHTRREDHQLDDEEAGALEILTGGEVSPLRRAEAGSAAAVLAGEDDEDEAVLTAVRAEPQPVVSGNGRTGDVREFIRKARSNYAMGSKKKTSKKKVTPISIRGAVTREYEENTLGELSQAPIDALDGLTARHAKMLEEAFGIKTVEDLARLKYVELARAICILARYEK